MCIFICTFVLYSNTVCTFIGLSHQWYFTCFTFLIRSLLRAENILLFDEREKCTKIEKKPSKTGKNSSALLALCVLLILTRAHVFLAFIFNIQGVFTYHVCAVTVQLGYIVYLIYARVRIHTHTHTRKCRYNSNSKYAQQPEIWLNNPKYAQKSRIRYFGFSKKVSQIDSF